MNYVDYSQQEKSNKELLPEKLMSISSRDERESKMRKWQQQQSTKEMSDEKSELFDSGCIDSGFLSSNITSGESLSECISEAIEPAVPISKIEPAQEILDSGVLDVDLSENLSHLSLANGVIEELTPLHLLPLRGDKKEKHDFAEAPTSPPMELWEVCYTQDNEGDTHLHIAVVQGFVEAALNLTDLAPHPCLLNIVNDDGQTALHLAILTKQPIIARRLVLAGADLKCKTSQGNTALHMACEAGDVACARALMTPVSHLESRKYLSNSCRLPPSIPPNFEQRNYKGQNCLHLAVSNGYVEIARMLLGLGADLEANEGLRGSTALQIAIRNRSKAMIDFLLNECTPNYQTENYAGYSAYQVALECENYELAKELVMRGAMPQPLTIMDDSDDEEDCDDEEFEIQTIQSTNFVRCVPRVCV